MVTDVQGSCYELVADDCNNMYTIFRQISDIKNIQTLSTLPKVSPPPQSRHKYSSQNNTPANPAFNDTASSYAAQFGSDHTPYNKTATTPISRPPHTNTQQTREREREVDISGTLHYPQNMLTSSLIYQGNELKTQIKIWEWCCIQSYLQYTESFLQGS